MIRQIAVVARKEIIDHVREVRSLGASLMHLLMGPLVILLISFSSGIKGNATGATTLAGMVSIFALLAVFVGGMNVSMDMMAGERERRSLLPLLLSPVSRLNLVIGKWLATSLFSVMGLAITLIAFAVLGRGGVMRTALFSGPGLLRWIALGLVPLGLLAAAVQIAISTVCKSNKEAQTYLSLLVFVPMGVSMFLVFFPQHLAGWAEFLPIAGQQAIALRLLHGDNWSMQRAIGVAIMTVCLAMATVAATGKLLERDNVVYGS